MRSQLLFPLFFLCLAVLTPPLHAQMVGDVDYGLASYYADNYDGSVTASREVYHKNELVGAHKLYPFGSLVRVKNTENNRQVTVRIIDRGPFISGRIIEVSTKAAEALGMIGQRSAQVEITLLGTPDQPLRDQPATPEPRDPVVVATPPPAPAETTPAPVPAETVTRPTRRADVPPTPADVATREADEAPRPERPVNTAPAAPPPATVTPAPPTRTVSDRAREQVKRRPLPKPDLDQSGTFGPGVHMVQLVTPPAGDFAVQVGSFSTLDHAMDKLAELQGRFFDNVLINKIPVGPSFTYKVLLGPFTDMKSAKNYQDDLKRRYKIAGFAVSLTPQP